MEKLTTGQRIAMRRRMMELSQEALGEELGVSRQAVSKWEADAAIPEIDKLVTMSRRFGVSVGWLLGVEDEDTPQPPEEFTPRERELMEKMIAHMPATPRWQKYTVIAAAVCAVLSLVISCCAFWRADHLQQFPVQSVNAMISEFQWAYETLNLLDQAELLSDYDYVLIPNMDLDEATVHFTGTPYYYNEKNECTLVVTLLGNVMAEVPCKWDGVRYVADFSLDAADGYTCYFLMKDEQGNQFRVDATNGVIMNLGQSMQWDNAYSVTYENLEIGENTLNFTNLHFYVSLPRVLRGQTDLWMQFELVLFKNDMEVDRLDLLNRSEYSRKLNFSGSDVDFTTASQTLSFHELSIGDSLTLVLEGKLTTGHELRYTIDTWHQSEDGLG